MSEPTADLRLVADWVVAEADDRLTTLGGSVYRRGRWLATVADNPDELGILAVSAYRTDTLAANQIDALALSAAKDAA